jgi:hypothetical protein
MLPGFAFRAKVCYAASMFAEQIVSERFEAQERDGILHLRVLSRSTMTLVRDVGIAIALVGGPVLALTGSALVCFVGLLVSAFSSARRGPATRWALWAARARAIRRCFARWRSS